MFEKGTIPVRYLKHTQLVLAAVGGVVVAAALASTAGAAATSTLGECLHSRGLTVGYYNPSGPYVRGSGPNYLEKPTLIPPSWNFAKAGTGGAASGEYAVDPQPLRNQPPADTPILWLDYSVKPGNNKSGPGFTGIGHFFIIWHRQPESRVKMVIACVHQHPDG
jgi:hypothetical protein